MRHLGTLPALALACLLWAAGALAQERLTLFGEGAQGPVEIRADELTARQEGDAGRVEARGDVVLIWNGYRLAADAATYDHRSAVATAEGAVRLTDADGNVLECRQLELNVVSQQGTIRDGTLLIAREGYRVWGKHFHKTGPATYEVEDGGFTACDGSWPSWRVDAQRVEVELEGYLKSRSASFWVEGVPLAYTPYLLFPVKRQRQAGFLLPKAGLSSRDGATIILRYFWPFADNADLLARLEYRSLRGWTQVGEFRYVLAEGHQGTVELSHLADRRDGSHKYTVKADHGSRFDDDTRVRLHVDYLGDTGYLKDFGDTIDDRGKDRLESYLLATRDVEAGTGFAWADYFQALNEPQGEVLQTLPKLGIVGRETPLGGRLAWDPSASATHFYRPEGTEGQVVELSPAVSWDAGASGLGLGLRVGYREQLYRVDGAWQERGAPRAEASAGATLARTWGGFVHTLEPSARFAWEDRAHGATPPDFVSQDDGAPRSAVTGAFSSRLLRASDLGEVAAFDLERALDFGRAGDDGWGRAWGPWRATLSGRPRERMKVRAEGAYDPQSSDPWLLGSVTAEDGDARGDRIFAGYQYVRHRAKYLDAGAELALAQPLSVQYRRRHSFEDGKVLEEGLSLHLSHTCWELVASFSRNYREDDDRFERRYVVALQLKGLGKLGTLRGVMP